ncbi:MAG: hypothetical protein A3H32_05540 [Betaproteobacteria bacterium RIFCSPLOWO2_02_FULL_63_19]|nr:MAG: hypothetical protein A3H32_05540 [Betaproteobacteria bacterium RIFCSPLOWO2_02_FULL_63_19]
MANRFSHRQRRRDSPPRQVPEVFMLGSPKKHAMRVMTGPLPSLEQLKSSYGGEYALVKLALLGRLARSELRTARAVSRLHDMLCFMRAYPDDARVLAQVERMLGTFHRRSDLKRHRAALADSGIAGTAVHYRFFWSTARWLARRWPERFRFDRGDAEPAQRLRAALLFLVTPAESAWLKESPISTFAALDRMRAPGESDAVFLIRRVETMPGDSASREAFYDSIDAACVLKPAPGAPSRTDEKHAAAPVSFQARPLRRTRPDLRAQAALAPRAVHEFAPRKAIRLLDLARGVMVTRFRDLDAFAYGDPRGVRLIDDGEGLAFMVNGVVPERRAVVPGTFGYLTLHNGVPVGYGDLIVTGRSVAVAFNTLETYRGGEAAWTFARLLAMLRHLFGSTSFILHPYQIGHRNEEAIASGAWWFYYKLGFRPRAPEARRIMREELARMKSNPGHRSDRATLRRLAASHLFFDLDAARPGRLPPLAEIGERVAGDLARRAGADRERAVKECSSEAMHLLGLRSLQGFTPGERLSWVRWAPLVASLPGLSRWSAAEKRALVRIVRAKGGRRESDFVALFAAHPKLERALFEVGD